MIWFYLHVAATWFMVGLIWLVQVVHYPLFNRIGREQFRAYEEAHTKAISLVVVPAMFLELGTAIWLCVSPVEIMSGALAWVNLGLLLPVWLSTFLIQVPQHQKLIEGFDEKAYRGLVGWNWLRTVLWSVRGVLLVYLQVA